MFRISLLILKSSLPTILQEALPFLVYFVNSYFLRLLNDNSLLGAVAIADSLYQIIIFGFGCGFGFGMNLLVAEAYGHRDLRQAGLFLHRCLLLNWTILIPSIVAFTLSARFFESIGTNPILANLAQDYLVYLIFPSILFFMNLSLMNFLIAFKYYKFPSFLTIIGAAIDAALAYYFAYYKGYGLVGLAIALGGFELIRFSGLLIYLAYFFRHRKALLWPSRASLRELVPQFRFQIVLVLVSLVMTMMMEVNQLYSGLLTKEEAAAQGLMFRFYVIFQSIPDTISYITCSKVSFHLGKGNPQLARKYVRATTYLIFVQAIVLSSLWLVFKDTLAVLLAGDDYELIPFITEILCNIGYVCLVQSVLLNYAKQLRRFKPNLTLRIIFAVVIIVQIPSGYFFAIYLNLRLTGLWMSIGLACLIMAVICAIFLHRIDFDEVSKEIQAKLEQEKAQDEQDEDLRS